MAFVVETTTTKPEGTVWFNVAYPEIYREIRAIYISQKDEFGLVAVDLKLVDSNTIVQKQIFLNEDASYAWSEFVQSQEPYQIRYQYNIENNINYTTQKYDV